MRKSVVLVSLLLAVSMSATAFAAPVGAEGDNGENITQGDFAQMMVKMLGLYRYLPPDPTDGECFAILMVNQIVPADGWQKKEPLTRGDLAMVVIKAMGEQDSVEDPDDPESWVAALQGMGVSFEDSIGQTARQVSDQVDATDESESAAFSPLSSDPIERQGMMGEPDERQLQSSMSNVASVPLTRNEVRLVLQGIDPNDIKPPAVTPN